MHKKTLVTVLLAGFATSGAAQAALHDRGGGLIYDDVLNLTWLRDANYAKTQYDNSGGAMGDADGKMTWADANTWAANLSYGGYDDWRLPKLNPSDTTCNDSFNGVYSGYNCTGGELSHLFAVDLGNKAGESVLNPNGDTNIQKANLALFSNVQSFFYWSDTELEKYPTCALYFYSEGGSQGMGCDKFSLLHALAVSPGDVAAVPEADTWAMLLAGLGLVGVAARRRRG